MGQSLFPDYVTQYLYSETIFETDLEEGLRAATMSLPESRMISSPDVGQFLSLLIHLTGTRRALEIGTFTGFTALKIASALPADGVLICCDISEEWTSVGRPYWQKAGVESRIDLRIAPALDTLLGLEPGFDFAFIDADKPSYDAYYERCLTLVRPGGLIVLDNMLWSGRVADPREHEPDTIAIRALNQKISKDPRVTSSLLTVGDGLMIATVT